MVKLKSHMSTKENQGCKFEGYPKGSCDGHDY